MSVLIDVRLAAIHYVARDINTFEFAPVDDTALPAAEPGAHVDVHLPNGIVRQYSLLTCELAPDSYTIGVKRDANSRGGSKYLFDQAKVGQTLAVSAPRNNFRLVEDAPHVVLIAGGIGVTPIWAMKQRLQSLGRSFEIHYSCRSRKEMAFLKDLRRDPSARLHFDDETNGEFLDLKAIVAASPAASHFYCCGPLPMLSAFERATEAVPSDRVHVEYFSPREEKSLAGGFVIELARSGRELVVPPGKTILQVLRAEGMEVPYSCEEGICGACEAKVLAGIPDHRDSVLKESERAGNKVVMLCCSGAKSDRLVLDL